MVEENNEESFKESMLRRLLENESEPDIKSQPNPENQPVTISGPVLPPKQAPQTVPQQVTEQISQQALKEAPTRASKEEQQSQFSAPLYGGRASQEAPALLASVLASLRNEPANSQQAEADHSLSAPSPFLVTESQSSNQNLNPSPSPSPSPSQSSMSMSMSMSFKERILYQLDNTDSLESRAESAGARRTSSTTVQPISRSGMRKKASIIELTVDDFDPLETGIPDFSAREHRVGEASGLSGSHSPKKNAPVSIHSAAFADNDNDDYEDEEDDDYEDDELDSRSRSRRKKGSRHIFRYVLIALVVLILGGGAFGYLTVSADLKPVNAADKSVQTVKIAENSSSSSIAEQLFKAKLVRNATVFKFYLMFKAGSSLKSGTYTLSPSMSVSYITSLLTSGGSASSATAGKITIPEGYTISQMADAVTTDSGSGGKTPITKAAFLSAVADPSFIQKMKSQYPQLFASLPSSSSGVKYQLEGYLFPATYDYSSSTSAEGLITQMIEAMNQALTPYYSKISQKKLTVNEVLSLAALTEKEANTTSDRQNVAQVWFNRLAANMPLGSNVALLYAEGLLGTKISLSQDASINTDLDSPYNLYKNTGTGPGPVDNPSATSISAVVNPTANSYLYFVADVKTGKLYFATTQAEQDANVQKYVNDQLSSSSK